MSVCILSACGNTGSTETISAQAESFDVEEENAVMSESEEEPSGNVDEMISTDIFDFCLSEVNYSDSISNIVSSRDISSYYRPASTAGSLITADSGNKLLSFTVSLKYTGTTEKALNLGDGSFADFTGEPDFLGFLVKYDDKYEFRVYMQVPEQVAEKSGKPVDLIISFCNHKYVFDIKP